MNESDKKYLTLAKTKSQRSTDSTQVGAVLVKSSNVLGLGYNGFAKRVNSTPDRTEIRELKHKFTVHAEINAIISAQTSLVGTTCYTWPFMPCSNCASALINAGVVRIVAPENNEFAHWNENFLLTKQICDESGTELTIISLDKIKEIV